MDGWQLERYQRQHMEKEWVVWLQGKGWRESHHYPCVEPVSCVPYRRAPSFLCWTLPKGLNLRPHWSHKIHTCTPPWWHSGSSSCPASAVSPGALSAPERPAWLQAVEASPFTATDSPWWLGELSVADSQPQFEQWFFASIPKGLKINWDFQNQHPLAS